MGWSRASLVGVALALCGCSSGPTVVEADTFVLRRTMTGPDAPPLAILGSNGAGAALGFLDHRGKVRLSLGLVDQVPRVFLADRNEQTRAALLVDAEGIPRVELFDAQGKLRATLALSTRGDGALTLEGPEGSAGALAAIDGRGGLLIRDRRGKAVVTLPERP